MGIVVIGAVFVDIKGFPEDIYVPEGRNAGRIEYIHGGVTRNVVEDIANVELRPTYVSIVDTSALGEDVVRKLKRHKVDTSYVKSVPGGMGTWLAVFDNKGDLAGSISQRPNLYPILYTLEEKGDEIISKADSIVLEMDIDKEIIKKTFQLAQKYNKRVYGVVTNMSIAVERRDYLKHFDCFVCNQIEAGIFFAEDYEGKTPQELCDIISANVVSAKIPSIVVTMGGEGAVYADCKGNRGIYPARKVIVRDTTGAGDAFFAGVAIGMTYGKELKEAVEIGTRLAASVIITTDNVCPRFLPKELGLDIEVEE